MTDLLDPRTHQRLLDALDALDQLLSLFLLPRKACLGHTIGGHHVQEPRQPAGQPDIRWIGRWWELVGIQNGFTLVWPVLRSTLRTPGAQTCKGEKPKAHQDSLLNKGG